MNEPIGLFISLSPDLALIIASDTLSTASSCPITLSCNLSASPKILLLSLSTSLLTGIFVQFETTSAMSSSVTSSFIEELFSWSFSFSFNFFSSSVSFPYLSSDNFSKS